MRAVVGKHGATVAIVALLVLNIVLIVPLIAHHNSGPDQAVAGGTSTAPTAQASPGSPSPTPDGTTSPTPAVKLTSGQPRRLLAVNSDQVAWRADAAGCGQVSKMQYTTDGGKTWQTTDSGLKGVVRLKAFGDSSVFAIGSDDNCKPVYAVDAYPGSLWQHDSALLSGTWYRVPSDLNAVHDPQGKTTQPCDQAGLVDFAGLGSSKAVALCGDGSLRSRAGGTSWQTTVEHSNAVAINADDNHFVMVEQDPQCAGLAVQRFNLHQNSLKTIMKPHCFKLNDPVLGNVAVSNRRSAVWLWSGAIRQV